jgi:hypothetical protein
VHPVDLAASAIAAVQFGVFSRRQALAAGATDALIRRRLANGRWLVAAPGVLALPGHPPSFRRSLWIAWLAAPATTVVSHWSGGHLRHLPGFPPNRLTLTVPHGSTHHNPIARVFQSSAMPTTERIDGLPVASVERVLCDVARLCGPAKLGALVEEARVAERTSVVRLRREFLRLARSGRNGITTMRGVLDKYEDGPTPPRSELERRLDAILDTLPVKAKHEAPLPGREWSNDRVDRLFDLPRRLIVEGDGRRWHTRVKDFARDRQRDRDALRHGYPTVRYAYEELTDDPSSVRQELLDLLGILEAPAIGIR